MRNVGGGKVPKQNKEGKHKIFKRSHSKKKNLAL